MHCRVACPPLDWINRIDAWEAKGAKGGNAGGGGGGFQFDKDTAKGCVLGAGEHEHDSHKWLKAEHIRDKRGRRPDDPQYDRSSLKLPAGFLGKGMSKGMMSKGMLMMSKGGRAGGGAMPGMMRRREKTWRGYHTRAQANGPTGRTK